MVLKFKDLLVENEKEFEAKRLAKHLNSGNWYNDSPVLFRGSERKVETWTIKKPYESRDPMTTDKKVQWFTEVFREEYYPSYPSRNKSRFGSTQKSIAKNYGDVYYVFPSKDATIGSLPDDAYIGYLGPATKDLGKFYSQMDKLRIDNFDIDIFKKSLPDDVIDFCKLVMNTRDKRNKDESKKIKNFLRGFEFDNIKSLSSKVDQSRFYIGRDGESNNNDKNMTFSTALRGLADFLNHIYDYFRLMKVDRIEENALEILIQGQLIQVNKEFAETYFEKTENGLVYQQD